MKKKLVAVLLAAMLVLTACGKKDAANTKSNAEKTNGNKTEQTAPAAELKDGTYTGVSEKDDHGGSIEVTVEVKEGKIANVTMKNMNADGTEKGEEYGKVDGEIKDQAMYDKAQQSLEGTAKYPEQLVEKGSVDSLEAVSGATNSLESFKDAANKALEQAK